MRYKKYSIVFLVIISCVFMAIIDGIIRPGYLIKSFLKMILFLIVPLIYSHYYKDSNIKSLFIIKKDMIKTSILSGFFVYIIIILSYVVLRNMFDFSSVVVSLNNNVGVNKTNFILVATYISFINSLLEEFFFRGFAFLKLKDVSTRRFSYIFSATAFALYHVSIMIGWFNIGITLLAIVGLFVGGVIFNFFNEKSENIYMSWIIHMCANFSINTVGCILFGII